MKVLLKYNNLIGANRGYMSSYLLFHIIYAVYLQYREECCDNDKGNVYYLLYNFLKFYYLKFDEKKKLYLIKKRRKSKC